MGFTSPVNPFLFLEDNCVNTPKTSFRLEPKLLKLMDRLITNPPPIIVDGNRGAARNRTELIEVLVRKAAEMQAELKEKE